tara:strand:- start:281 stop:460 length:180 start_codon:yes stop_codon:yes gene_type:complete
MEDVVIDKVLHMLKENKKKGEYGDCAAKKDCEDNLDCVQGICIKNEDVVIDKVLHAERK